MEIMEGGESKKYDNYVHKSDELQHGEVTDNADDLQRHLGNRQIQLIAIGGSIGTALFVSVGGALNKGRSSWNVNGLPLLQLSPRFGQQLHG
jgi:amino acid transporter